LKNKKQSFYQEILLKIIKYFKKIFINCLPYYLYKQLKKVNKKIKIFKLNKLDLEPPQNFGIIVANNDECVILGNGPSLKNSLKETSLNFIKARKKFCVNDAVISDEFNALKPEYVVFMDQAYISPKTAEPNLSRYKKEEQILSKADWEIKIFMPIGAKLWNHFIEVPLKNKNVKIIYINSNMSQFEDEQDKFIEYKQNISMPRITNVLISSLYIAINAGYKKIYLYGADHSWHESINIRADNVVCYKDRHFYDKKEVTTCTPVYKNPECNITFTMAELFTMFGYNFASYMELERYSIYMGAKIYNASNISFIDAFERIL
jgi:hypothetical protein